MNGVRKLLATAGLGLIAAMAAEGTVRGASGRRVARPPSAPCPMA